MPPASESVAGNLERESQIAGLTPVWFCTTTLGFTNSDGARQKFTQYERDGETDLDFARARYYAPLQGRFTSVDPLMPSGRPPIPQSWNRYAYVRNNPIRLVDPSGMQDQRPKDRSNTCSPATPCTQVSEQEAFNSPPLIRVELDVPFSRSSAPAPIQTNETPIFTTLSPSVGPSSGPIQRPPLENGSSGFGLFGVSLGGYAGAMAGGGGAVNVGVSVGINTNGNGGMGGDLSFGGVLGGSRAQGGFGYPSQSGVGLGVAAGIGPGVFWSNAEDFKQLEGPFDTTVIATPYGSFQWDRAVGDNTLKITVSPGKAAGLGIFHFRTTTIAGEAPVTVPLKRW